jgi:hypothetical protein
MNWLAVGHLGGLPVAVAADVRDVLAHPLQERQHPGEGGFGAAHHEGQPSGLGAHFATSVALAQATAPASSRACGTWLRVVTKSSARRREDARPWARP